MALILTFFAPLNLTVESSMTFFLQVRVTFVEVDFITILTETNECQSNPCQNGGTCVDDVYKFTCLCPNAYAGTFCQGKAKYN